MKSCNTSLAALVASSNTAFAVHSGKFSFLEQAGKPQ